MGNGHGTGRVGEGQAYEVLRTESSNGYEVRVLETNMGQGGAGIRVLVWCCMECNTNELATNKYMSHKWIVNSGALALISSNQKSFNTYQKLDSPQRV